MKSNFNPETKNMKTSYRFFFWPNDKGKRLYMKTSGCDITKNPFEAKIYRTDNPEDTGYEIKKDLQYAFDIDSNFAHDPQWMHLDASEVDLYFEKIPKDELTLMKTGNWKRILATI
jgi:hypothetical protein